MKRIVKENKELENGLAKYGLRLTFETCTFDKSLNKTSIYKEFSDMKGMKVRVTYE